jgi:flagellar motor switch protein FliM
VRRRVGAADATAYDFTRPIQLSREHSRMLQVCFDGFARQATTVFTSSLRTVSAVSMVSIEQRSYAEYIEALDSSTYMTIFTIDPMPGSGVVEMPLTATMSCVDHLLGGPGSSNQPARPLSEIESGVLRNLIDRLLGELHYSMSEIVDIDANVRGIEYSPQFAQVSSAADVVVVVTFELRIDEATHRMTICLPFNALLPHLLTAARPDAVSERERNQRETALERLDGQMREVAVDVAVQLRPTSLPAEALEAMRPGSVLRLSHPASAPLDVTLDNKVFAHATPGTHRRKLAALIVATPEKETR